MAEILIPKVMQALKTARQSKANAMHIRYDDKGDVMSEYESVLLSSYIIDV